MVNLLTILKVMNHKIFRMIWHQNKIYALNAYFLDMVGPITYQIMQMFYYTPFTHGIQIFCMALFVIGPTIKKKITIQCLNISQVTKGGASNRGFVIRVKNLLITIWLKRLIFWWKHPQVVLIQIMTPRVGWSHNRKLNFI